jgi:hypothetical protein
VCNAPVEIQLYLKICEDGNGVIILQFNLADQTHQVFLLVVLSMREVEPEHVGAGEEELLDHL